MKKAAAKKGDTIKVNEQHPTQVGNAVSPVPYTFTASINGALSTDVFVMGDQAAVNGSTASGDPSHKPIAGNITPAANNDGKVTGGSASVLINGKWAARNGDSATGCSNAVPPNSNGEVLVGNASSTTVVIGD